MGYDPAYITVTCRLERFAYDRFEADQETFEKLANEIETLVEKPEYKEIVVFASRT